MWRLQNPDRAKEEDERSQRKKRAPAKKTAPKTEKKTVDGSDAFLKEMKQQLAEIDNAEIRAKAQDIYDQADSIFAWVNKHPDCADDVRRFCDYYPVSYTHLVEAEDILLYPNYSQVNGPGTYTLKLVATQTDSLLNSRSFDFNEISPSAYVQVTFDKVSTKKDVYKRQVMCRFR